MEISHSTTTDEDDPNKLRSSSRTSKTVTGKLCFPLNFPVLISNKYFPVTSSNPTLLSSAKIEPVEEYDDEEDDLDEDLDDDYYSQSENMEPKSRRLPTTTDVPPEDTTVKGEETTLKIFSQRSSSQKQVTAILNPDKNVRLVQTQNGRTVKYPPDSNPKSEGKTKVSEHFEHEDSNPQDITISKTTQKIKYKTRYLPSKATETKNEIVDDDAVKKMKIKPESYVSVTNSMTGTLNENNQENGKFASTYFTKSSTCGHFTFTCNTVYGSEGRSKICRPKQNNPKC